LLSFNTDILSTYLSPGHVEGPPEVIYEIVPLHGAVWLCVGIEVVPANSNVRRAVNSSYLEGKHAFIDSTLVVKFLDH